MNVTTIKAINVGFGNTSFITRDSDKVQDTITQIVMDDRIALIPNKPNAIKVETIDALHDKLSLLYDDETENVEGTITWRKSQDDKHYVFTKFE